MRRASRAAILAGLVLFLSNCGGGGGGGVIINPPPPPPTTLTITTNSLPTATVSVAYSTTVAATGGTGARTWTALNLPAGLQIGASTGTISGTPTASGTSNVTLQVTDSGSPPQSTSKQLSLTVNAPAGLTITTASLPAGTQGTAYNTTVQSSGGQPPLTWSATGLPAGLNIGAGTGTISGTPTASGNFNPTIQVMDSGASPQTATKQLALVINSPAAICAPPASPSGRNDSIATASVLTTGGNCTLTASISPFNDASTTGPDQDFYRLTAATGATVMVEIFARRTNPDTSVNLNSGLDSVVEILQTGGPRFTTCREGGDGSTTGAVDGVNGNTDLTPMAFDDQCVNDDLTLGTLKDSKIEFQNQTGGTVTFIIRVFDWRGDARPDFRYFLKITGAN